MAPFHLSTDADGVIMLKILRVVQDSEGPKLVADITAAVTAVRATHGVVHILFDNRESAFFSGIARTKLIETMGTLYEPGDRTALLVTSSMMKVRAKSQMNERTQAFLSEPAARTWLRAWIDRTAPAMLMAAK